MKLVASAKGQSEIDSCLHHFIFFTPSLLPSQPRHSLFTSVLTFVEATETCLIVARFGSGAHSGSPPAFPAPSSWRSKALLLVVETPTVLWCSELLFQSG